MTGEVKEMYIFLRGSIKDDGLRSWQAPSHKGWENRFSSSLWRDRHKQQQGAEGPHTAAGPRCGI